MGCIPSCLKWKVTVVEGCCINLLYYLVPNHFWLLRIVQRSHETGIPLRRRNDCRPFLLFNSNAQSCAKTKIEKRESQDYQCRNSCWQRARTQSPPLPFSLSFSHTRPLLSPSPSSLARACARHIFSFSEKPSFEASVLFSFSLVLTPKPICQN